MSGFWKEDWELGRQRLIDWWNRKGCALHVTAIKDEPWEQIPNVDPPETQEEGWTDPYYRTQSQMHWMSRTYYGGVAFPYLDTQIGPGSLGLFLGNEPGFAPSTVWYEPCIEDPETHPPLRFDSANKWFQIHMRLVEESLRLADGRFLVGMPDLIENLDTLAQLRDPQTLMFDLIERPDWVERSIWEINQAFFEAFDAIYRKIETPWGGNAFAAFQIWGPGKTAKVQCDAFAMIGPKMSKAFVLPALEEQCKWLDYSMFHLDGTQAVVHLDGLLGVDSLNAIEWTPQAGIERGGNARWYELYRRVLSGGKAVQAIDVEYEEVLPLLDACGHEGMFVMTSAPDEESARRLVEQVYG